MSTHAYHQPTTYGPDMPAIDPLTKRSLAKMCWNSLHLDCHDKDCECWCHHDELAPDDIEGTAV